MRTQYARPFSRRRFLGGLMLAGTAGLLGPYPRSVAAEPPPEVTKLRLTASQPGGICIAPKYVAEALLQTEGFTDIHYTDEQNLSHRMKLLASGETDLEVTFVGPFITRIDAGAPIVILAGGHIGCFELFGTERVRAIRDLKEKTVAVSGIGEPDYAFLASLLTYIGLDPRKDVTWVIHPPTEAMELLAEGKIDALLSFPPVPQELRARQIGHVVVNSTVDRPWSQYFCCLVAGNRAFVRQHPMATKRAVRAILKAADVCALDPQWAARFLVDKGYVKRYDYALQVMQELPYGKWRDYDPEDTIRFYALRLHEAGMIKNTPQKIIAQGTDWRFLTALKKELKG
jgi:NitT/TauT family transport system substrate-binding protein